MSKDFKFLTEHKHINLKNLKMPELSQIAYFIFFRHFLSKKNFLFAIINFSKKSIAHLILTVETFFFVRKNILNNNLLLSLRHQYPLPLLMKLQEKFIFKGGGRIYEKSYINISILSSDLFLCRTPNYF